MLDNTLPDSWSAAFTVILELGKVIVLLAVGLVKANVVTKVPFDALQGLSEV